MCVWMLTRVKQIITAHTETCNLACIDLGPLMHPDPDHMQKPGWSDLFYGSKSPSEKSRREWAFSSQLSLTTHRMFIVFVMAVLFRALSLTRRLCICQCLSVCLLVCQWTGYTTSSQAIFMKLSCLQLWEESVKFCSCSNSKWSTNGRFYMFIIMEAPPS